MTHPQERDIYSRKVVGGSIRLTMTRIMPEEGSPLAEKYPHGYYEISYKRTRADGSVREATYKRAAPARRERQRKERAKDGPARPVGRPRKDTCITRIRERLRECTYTEEQLSRALEVLSMDSEDSDE